MSSINIKNDNDIAVGNVDENKNNNNDAVTKINSEGKDHGMFWNIIDSDTLSIGRSTPAFTDKHPKPLNSSISSPMPSAVEEKKLIVENSNEMNKIDQSSSILSPYIDSKSGTSYFRIEEEGEDEIGKDRPNLLNTSSSNAINHALEDNHILIREESSTPCEVFDVPSSNLSQYDSDTQNSCLAVDDNEQLTSISDVSINDILISQTPVLLDHDDEEYEKEFIKNGDESQTFSENNEETKEISVLEKENNNISNEDDTVANDPPSYIHLVFGKDQNYKFSTYCETRCRSSSADEDLAVLRESSKTPSINNDNSVKSELIDVQSDNNYGLINSIFKMSESACLKMKDIFIVFFLGNMIYDQKSPIPFLLSHTLAFLVGAFVGRKMSLNTPNSSPQPNVFFCPKCNECESSIK